MSAQLFRWLPLDPSIYNLQADEIAFFKTQSGIHDDEELKNHILGVQAEAYAIHAYPCIRRLNFTTLKVSRHPAYDAVLRIGREKPDALLLELGCFFGSDTRKVVADGYPLKNVIASDLRREFWNLGHKLFRSSQESFPVAFLPGDIFNPKFLAPNVLPAPSSSTPPPSEPVLPQVTSLTQLQHRISVIHISAVFHLFSKTQQHDLAHLVGSLLSPLPGSMIFGSQIGMADTEDNNDDDTGTTTPGTTLFRHTPSSWEKLWTGEGGVFKPGDVVISTSAEEFGRDETIRAGGDPTHTTYLLVWSVKRA